MKERPILFSGPMVRALLAGTKTQTRRVIKGVSRDNWLKGANNHVVHAVDLCPYGKPGDRLWVRETFIADEFMGCRYRADGRQFVTINGKKTDTEFVVKKWKPAIHMFRWASRITLEITGIRIERLNVISQSDAIAEGIEAIKDNSGFGNEAKWKDYSEEGSMPFDRAFPVHSYATLWESINGPGSWDSNPWVWVIEFKRVK